jgi:hypothetical protein
MHLYCSGGNTSGQSSSVAHGIAAMSNKTKEMLTKTDIICCYWQQSDIILCTYKVENGLKNDIPLLATTRNEERKMMKA